MLYVPMMKVKSATLNCVPNCTNTVGCVQYPHCMVLLYVQNSQENTDVIIKWKDTANNFIMSDAHIFLQCQKLRTPLFAVPWSKRNC